MKTATQNQPCNAKQMNAFERKKVALKVIRNEQPVTHIARENEVSRKFVYTQKNKAVNAVDDAFSPPPKKEDKVLFNLPVTLPWLYQLILCLVLHGCWTKAKMSAFEGDKMTSEIMLRKNKCHLVQFVPQNPKTFALQYV